jgi:hypothetical protein
MYSATFSGPMLSLASCDIRVAGKRIVGLTKADIEDGVKREKEYGSGPIALGAAIGIHEATLSFDQHLQEAMALQSMLNLLAGGAGYAMAIANMSFTFTGIPGVKVAGLATPVRSVEIDEVQFLKWKKGPSNDGKSIVGSWETLVLKPIRINGIYSMNPDIFSTSNSITIGLGGEVVSSG